MLWTPLEEAVVVAAASDKASLLHRPPAEAPLSLVDGVRVLTLSTRRWCYAWRLSSQRAAAPARMTRWWTPAGRKCGSQSGWRRQNGPWHRWILATLDVLACWLCHHDEALPSGGCGVLAALPLAGVLYPPRAGSRRG